MSDLEKTYADSIVIVIHRGEFGWGGQLMVNGETAAECNAGTAEAVVDSVWSASFCDEVGSDACYTTDEKPADV